MTPVVVKYQKNISGGVYKNERVKDGKSRGRDVNGSLLTEETVLHSYDTIYSRKYKNMFVLLCGKRFGWER